MAPHLQKITDERVFEKKQREKAAVLMSNVTDENFLILMAFHIDVLSLMSTQSLMYQKTGGSIISEYSRQEYFASNLEKLKSGESNGLKNFLAEVKCARTAKELQKHLTSKCKTTVKSCNKISNFENNMFKSYRCVRIYGKSFRPHSKFEPLSKYLVPYIEKLISEHKKMFLDDDMLKNFEILDFKKWKSPLSTSFERESIKKIGEYFQIQNHASLGIIWTTFKETLMKSSFFCQHRSDELNVFWSALLEDRSLRIDDPLRKTIQTILVLGVSSASAERLFSVMTHIR